MPLTWLTLYQPEPDFQPGQLVPQLLPLTVPTTVTLALRPSRTLIVAVVEAVSYTHLTLPTKA